MDLSGHALARIDEQLDERRFMPSTPLIRGATKHA
jgi:hypothetical protein